ncbi:MAG: NAD(P)H-hydrate dehydratase [Ruminococcaceae bacterium]|nr:NAD(P)H-hydrate dehydratase [Oscillospiraceae bacterium]
MQILTVEQIKQLEAQFAEQGNDHIKLMEEAGDTIARFVHERFGIQGKAIAVVCGHGNNGGDGFAAAKKFYDNGAKVCVLLADGAPTTDDAIDMFGRAERAGVHMVICSDPEAAESVDRFILEADVVIDALFGAGFHGEMPEHLVHLTELMCITEAEVISADIPSGVNANTGEAAECSVKADYTLTFTAMKPGHIIYPGAGRCGTILITPIGIAPDAVRDMPPQVSIVERSMVKLCFQERESNTYKGSYGSLLAVCGSEGMAGAAVFAGKAAVQSGVGLVRMVLPKSIYPIASSHLIDPVYTPLPDSQTGTLRADAADRIMELLSGCTACLVGCGLGCNNDTKAVVKRIIEESTVPVIIDADGLNAIADDTEILKSKHAPIIITPHAGEMGRLTGKSGAEVQTTRLNTARDFAQEYGVFVVLKGAGTIIASPDGTAQVNMTGNPGMAKGGSGDVLAGIIASLAAQGQSAGDACMCGVNIHGTAGDKAAERFSRTAMTPMDIIFDLPTVFQEIEH